MIEFNNNEKAMEFLKIKRLEAQLSEAEKLEESARIQLLDKKEKTEKARNEVEDRIKKMRSEIAKCKSEISQNEKTIEEISFYIQTSKELLQEMNEIVLVHPSARLDQMYKHQCKRLWVTETDQKVFEELENRTGGVFTIDKVCSVPEIDIEIPDLKSDGEEMQSILDFCKVAIFLHRECKQTIYLACKDIDIYRILKINGISKLKI